MLRCNNTDNFTRANILTRIQGQVQRTFEERTTQLRENKKMQEMHWKTCLEIGAAIVKNLTEQWSFEPISGNSRERPSSFSSYLLYME